MKRLERVLRKARRSLLGRRPQSDRILGDQQRALGDWVMAARHYAAHVQKHPQDVDIWIQLGHAYKEARRYDDADRAYGVAETLSPTDTDLLLCRGHLSKLRGEHERAVVFYERSFALDANPDAERELAQLPAAAALPPYDDEPVGRIEGLQDAVLFGQAVDPETRGVPARVEVVSGDRVIAEGVAGISGARQAAALGLDESTGFRIDLSNRLDLTRSQSVVVRLAGSERHLEGSPIEVGMDPIVAAWSRRWRKAGGQKRSRQAAGVDIGGRTLTFCLPGSDADALAALMDDIEAQWSQNWRGVIRFEGGSPGDLPLRLADRVAEDTRWRVASAGSTGPIDDDALLSAMDGGHMAVLAPGSRLEPEAGWCILRAAQQGADLIYWDEARIGVSPASIERLVLRPAYSPEHFSAFPGLIGSFAVSASLLGSTLRANPGLASHDHSALLKACLEAAACVAHVPAVLERLPAACLPPAPPRRSRPARRAADAPGRTLAMVLFDVETDQARTSIRSLIAAEPRDTLDVAIASQSDRVIEGLSRTLGDRMRTVDARACLAETAQAMVERWGEDYANLVLLDRPLRGVEGWLTRLGRSGFGGNVGARAPILAARNGAVYSAGVGLGRSGLIHSHRGVPLSSGLGRTPGWNRGLLSLREQSAAVGCLLVPRPDFQALDGLDPTIAADLRLADLCLRLGRLGKRTLIDPEVVLTVAENPRPDGYDKVFRSRWAAEIEAGDPFSHPAMQGAAIVRPPSPFDPARIRRVHPSAGQARPPRLQQRALHKAVA